MSGRDRRKILVCRRSAMAPRPKPIGAQADQLPAVKARNESPPSPSRAKTRSTPPSHRRGRRGVERAAEASTTRPRSSRCAVSSTARRRGHARTRRAVRRRELRSPARPRSRRRGRASRSSRCRRSGGGEAAPSSPVMTISGRPGVGSASAGGTAATPPSDANADQPARVRVACQTPRSTPRTIRSTRAAVECRDRGRGGSGGRDHLVVDDAANAEAQARARCRRGWCRRQAPGRRGATRRRGRAIVTKPRSVTAHVAPTRNAWLRAPGVAAIEQVESVRAEIDGSRLVGGVDVLPGSQAIDHGIALQAAAAQKQSEHAAPLRDGDAQRAGRQAERRRDWHRTAADRLPQGDVGHGIRQRPDRGGKPILDRRRHRRAQARHAGAAIDEELVAGLHVVVARIERVGRVGDAERRRDGRPSASAGAAAWRDWCRRRCWLGGALWPKKRRRVSLRAARATFGQRPSRWMGGSKRSRSPSLRRSAPSMLLLLDRPEPEDEKPVAERQRLGAGDDQAASLPRPKGLNGSGRREDREAR